MGRWVRLVWLLAALGAAGIFIVHYQTEVVTAGYRLSGLLDRKETLRETNRTLRIELGRAGVPDQVKKSWEILATEEATETTERATPSGEIAPGGEEDGNE